MAGMGHDSCPWLCTRVGRISMAAGLPPWPSGRL